MKNNDNQKPAEKPEEKTPAQEKIAEKNQPAQEDLKKEKDTPTDNAPKVVKRGFLWDDLLKISDESCPYWSWSRKCSS